MYRSANFWGVRIPPSSPAGQSQREVAELLVSYEILWGSTPSLPFLRWTFLYEFLAPSEQLFGS